MFPVGLLASFDDRLSESAAGTASLLLEVQLPPLLQLATYRRAKVPPEPMPNELRVAGNDADGPTQKETLSLRCWEV